MSVCGGFLRVCVLFCILLGWAVERDAGEEGCLEDGESVYVCMLVGGGGLSSRLSSLSLSILA